MPKERLFQRCVAHRANTARELLGETADFEAFGDQRPARASDPRRTAMLNMCETATKNTLQLSHMAATWAPEAPVRMGEQRAF